MATFLEKHPRYGPDAAPILYHHLDPQFFFFEGEDDYSANWPAISLAAIATTELLALSCTSSQTPVIEMMREWWPNICKWLDLFARYCIWVDTPRRYRAREVMLGTLQAAFGFVMRHRDFLNTYFVAPMFRMWFGLLNNPHFEKVMYESGLVSGVLDAVHCVVGSILSEKSAQDATVQKVMQLVTDHTAEFVAATTAHVRRDVAAIMKESNIGLLPNRHPALTTLATVNWMTEVTPYARAFPYTQLIPTVISLLDKLTELPFNPSTADKALHCVVDCFEFFHSAITGATGHEWLIRALELNILGKFLQMKPWLFWASSQEADIQEDVESMSDFITHIICPHLICPQIVRATARALRKLARGATYRDDKKVGCVKPAWEAMESAVASRLNVLALHPPICGNSEVSLEVKLRGGVFFLTLLVTFSVLLSAKLRCDHAAAV